MRRKPAGEIENGDVKEPESPVTAFVERRRTERKENSSMRGPRVTDFS